MRKEKPLKIVHLASGDLWAGAEVQLYYLASALNRYAGINVQVILLNYGTLETKLRESGVTVIVIDESKNSFLTILITLLQLLSRIRPDVVHTHRKKENVLGSVASLIVGATSVRTVHGEPEFIVSIRQLRKKLYSLTDYFCGRYLQKAVIAVSQDLKEKLHRMFPADRITVVTNAIDSEEVLRRAQDHTAFTSEESVVKVGIVGRLVPVKRMDLFVTIAGELHSRFPGKFHFQILGDGPLMSDLKSQVHNNGLEKQIELLGFRENALPYIMSMDLLIITSEHEGLPMTLLEAMCLGVPVVARAVGGIPAVLCDGEFGLLVHSDDALEFANVISKYLVEQKHFLARAYKAKQHVELNYSTSRTTSEYVKLYARLTAAQ
jgi:glycosyltransferase involved in cell wall biosynthesis